MTDPGGGRTGMACGAAAVMGGRECGGAGLLGGWFVVSGGGGACGRAGSQVLMGFRRLPVVVKYWEGDCVGADREGKLGDEVVYIGPSG